MPLIGSLSLSIAGALNYQTNPREEKPDNSNKKTLQSVNFPLFSVGIQNEKGMKKETLPQLTGMDPTWQIKGLLVFSQIIFHAPEDAFSVDNKFVKTAILNSIFKRQIIQKKCF